VGLRTTANPAAARQHTIYLSQHASGHEGVKVGISVVGDTTLVELLPDKRTPFFGSTDYSATKDEPVLVPTESGIMGLLVAQTGSLYLERLPLTAVVSKGNGLYCGARHRSS
jgi:hypothetical protein